jgi:hypothetical protein
VLCSIANALTTRNVEREGERERERVGENIKV